MATIFAAFGKSIGNNKGSVQNFGIVGITIASEELTKFIFFYCPCDYPSNKLYGSIFIWGPGVILLIVGYLANRRTWRLTTGLCNRTQGIGRGGKRIFHFIFIFLSIGIKAMIAPATWVVLAFLKGDYYTCAAWPDPEDPEARAKFQLKHSNGTVPRPCIFNPNPAKFDGSDAEIIARNLRARSHTIGWFYVSLGMLLGVCGMFYMRCRSKYSYEQSNYIDRYRANEVELFETELDKKSEEQAKRIVEGYFSKVRAKEEWDQIAVINDKVTRSKRGRAIYSPLHKFVNKELRAMEETPAIPDLVSDAAMKKRKAVTKTHKKNSSKNDGREGGNIAGGPAIPMTTVLVTGGGSKPLLLKSNPVKIKSDGFADSPGQSSIQGTPAHSSLPTSVVIENETSLAVPEVAAIDPPSVPTPAEVSAEKAFPSPKENPVQPEATEINDESKDMFKPSPKLSPREQLNVTLPARQEAEGNNPASPVAITDDTNSSDDSVITAEPPPSKQNQPAIPHSENDLTPDKQEITETSLGDFGGAISREDLDVQSSSGESNDRGEAGVIVFEGQDMPSDVDINSSDQQDEGYMPLLNNDEVPLLSDE